MTGHVIEFGIGHGSNEEIYAVEVEQKVGECTGATQVRARGGRRWIRLRPHRFACLPLYCGSNGQTARIRLPRAVSHELQREGEVRLSFVIRLRTPDAFTIRARDTLQE